MQITLSKKQAQSINESDARYNLWIGAVRSGKSFASLLAFEDFCKNGPPGAFMILGKSFHSIKRNVVYPLKELLGDRFQYYLGKGEATLYNRTIHIVGANDERAAHKIQGSTLAGVYADEIATLPEPVFEMLKSRMSVKGARLIGTTNPDSPFHWLKTKFIDRSHELDIKYWNFSLEDNPSLDPVFVSNIKKEYQGLWYQRYIEGKWVLAEGTIFDFFNKENHVISFPPGAAEYYICGVDYGTTNPCAFTLIGYSSKTYPNIWLEKEYYWDSKKTLRQKTDTDYGEDLKKFLQGYNVRSIYIDPSAVSFRVELLRQGFSGLVEAENDVLDGIRFHSLLLSNGTFKICHNCTKSIEEYQTYCWDEKSSSRGEDKPKKENDHCFAAGSLVSTPLGRVPIEHLKIGDHVLTRNGKRKIISTWQSIDEKELIDVEGIKCTPGHMFVTQKGKVPAGFLTQSDILYKIDPLWENSWKKKRSFGMKENGIDIQKEKIHQNPNTLKATNITYTEKYGNSTMVQFQKECTYTTRMKTKRIMKSKTLSYCQSKNICLSTPQKREQLISENKQKELDHLQNYGTVPKMEEIGIKRMELDVGKLHQKNNLSVKIVQNNFNSRSCTTTQDSAQMHVNHPGEESRKSMTNKEFVSFVTPTSSLINMSIQQHALGRAPQNRDGKKERVYNLTVEEDHEYFVNGFLVGNCMDSIRYALYTSFFKGVGPRMTAEDVDRLRTEVQGDNGQKPLGKFFDDRMW